MPRWKKDEDEISEYTRDDAESDEESDQRNVVERHSKKHYAWVHWWYYSINHTVTQEFIEENQGHGDGDEQKW